MTVNRLSVLALLAAGLALAGCGRKSSLEPPPSASVGPATPVAGQPSLGEPEHPALEGERRAAAVEPAAGRKSFFLDFLIASERPNTPPRDQTPAR